MNDTPVNECPRNKFRVCQSSVLAHAGMSKDAVQYEPLWMDTKQAEEASSFKQMRKEGTIIGGDPAMESPLSIASEGEEQAECNKFARMQFGAWVSGKVGHGIVNFAEYLQSPNDSKSGGGDLVAEYRWRFPQEGRAYDGIIWATDEHRAAKIPRKYAVRNTT